jgi:hypothetical protein
MLFAFCHLESRRRVVTVPVYDILRLVPLSRAWVLETHCSRGIEHIHLGPD